MSKGNPPRTTGTKICSGCHIEKSVLAFAVQPSCKDGLRHKCRDCVTVDIRKSSVRKALKIGNRKKPHEYHKEGY